MGSFGARELPAWTEGSGVLEFSSLRRRAQDHVRLCWVLKAMYSRLYTYTDMQFHHSLFKDLYQARTLGKAKGKREYSHSNFWAVIEL